MLFTTKTQYLCLSFIVFTCTHIHTSDHNLLLQSAVLPDTSLQRNESTGAEAQKVIAQLEGKSDQSHGSSPEDLKVISRVDTKGTNDEPLKKKHAMLMAKQHHVPGSDDGFEIQIGIVKLKFSGETTKYLLLAGTAVGIVFMAKYPRQCEKLVQAACRKALESPLSPMISFLDLNAPSQHSLPCDESKVSEKSPQSVNSSKSPQSTKRKTSKSWSFFLNQ